MISDSVERREAKQICLQAESTKGQLANLPPRKVSAIESQMVIKGESTENRDCWRMRTGCS